MDRRLARTQAVQVLYLKRSSALTMEAALGCFQALGDPLHELALQFCHGVDASLEEIDQQIQGAARNWRLERMAWVDLSILRLGVFELRTGTAPAIVIDEAVEIARRLGGEQSPGFVNGILDAIAKSEGAPKTTGVYPG